MDSDQRALPTIRGIAVKNVKLKRPGAPAVLLSVAMALPLLTSSLGGLTHRLSCTSAWTPDFELNADGVALPTVASALIITRESVDTPEPCPKFSLVAEVQPVSSNLVSTRIIAKNTSTKSTWATAEIQLAGDSSLIPLGPLGSGATIEKTVMVRVPRGERVLRARIRLGG